MWCVYKSHVCFMVVEKSTGKIRFIRERKWLAMTDDEQSRFEW